MQNTPRLCAHRGINDICPENTLPAFETALKIGAEEIEFDISATKDGEIVICHDMTVDRTTDGSGKIDELLYGDIKKLDAGSWFDKSFAGTKLPVLEDAFKCISTDSVINLHIKTPGKDGFVVKKAAEAVYKYGLEDTLYFAGHEEVLKSCVKIAPDIQRCALHANSGKSVVSQAMDYGCKRFQINYGYFNNTMVKELKDNGIICNMFFAGTTRDEKPGMVKEFLEMGVDCVLTNQYASMIPVLASYIAGNNSLVKRR